MADLIDTGAAWPAGIRQIETTDPVIGGVPNIGTGAGMTNIPHLQLAQRTQVLKTIIDGAGLGATAVPLVTLNAAAARVTGSYRFLSTDGNTPATGVAGTVQVIAASASAVNQIASDSASTRMWTRFWNGTVWSAWDLIWSSARGTRTFGSAGFSRLPDGTLLQWGLATLPASGLNTGGVFVVLPTAMSSVNYAVSAVTTRGGHSVNGGYPSISADNFLTTGFDLFGEMFAFSVFNQTVPVRWLAMGY